MRRGRGLIHASSARRPAARRRPARVAVIASGLCLAVAAIPARAIEDRADLEPNELPVEGRSFAWKATLGRYLQSAAANGTDLNLRGSDDDDTFWLGMYQEGGGFQQARAGYERQVRVPIGRVIGSLQVASGGFVGGAVTLEASHSAADRFFGLIGLGRTNLRPYVNLGFDPNDSILLGVGWRPDAATQVTFFQVRDDRLDTGQRVTHLVLRRQFATGDALSVDAFRREGRADPSAQRYAGTGIALTWSHAAWFVRLAYDPHANFTASDMTRLALGARF